MSDLISREDAIEAIQNAYCKPCKERGDDYNEVRCRACDYDDAIIQIDALPSAEAVPWSVADKIGEDRERLEERVSELEERLEWIPCSERLPNTTEQVLISVCDDHGDTPYHYTCVGWRCENYWISDNDYVFGNVLAWMPLPKPYREDGEA